MIYIIIEHKIEDVRLRASCLIEFKLLFLQFFDRHALSLPRIVEVGTIFVQRAFLFWAGQSLKNRRMIKSLFPTMAEPTFVLQFAAFSVTGDESGRFPRLAHFCVVVVDPRRSSEILPVVRINAFGLVMFVVQRTPLSFEKKQVKFWGFGNVIDQADFDIFNIVREGAKLTIFAQVDLSGK